MQETSIPAKYEVLQAYLMNRYPNCEITVMYEAGFQGFWLHDLLEDDDIKCIVTPRRPSDQLDAQPGTEGHYRYKEPDTAVSGLSWFEWRFADRGVV